MISVVNHTVRKELKLDLYEYVILERLVQARQGGQYLKARRLSETLGMPQDITSLSIKRLLNMGMITKSERHVSEIYVPTDEAISKVLIGTKAALQVDNPSSKSVNTDTLTKATMIWNEIRPYLSEHTKRKYQEENTYVVGLIEALIAQNKEELTAQHFKAVIWDRTMEWSENEEMKKYLRPSTFFRKSNFWRYLAMAKEALYAIKSKN